MAATATARIQPKKQTLDDAYAPPANFLEIDVVQPETHGVGKKRYTDYEVRMKVTLALILDMSQRKTSVSVIHHIESCVYKEMVIICEPRGGELLFCEPKCEQDSAYICIKFKPR